MFLIKDKRAFASHLECLATPEVTRIIVAHHEVINQPRGRCRSSLPRSRDRKPPAIHSPGRRGGRGGAGRGRRETEAIFRG